MEQDRKDEHGSFKEDLKEMIIFFSVLLFIILFLFFTKYIVTKRNINFNLPAFIKNRLSYCYIISFGFLSGLLVFFGIKSFDNMFNRFFDNMALTNLTSVTIVIAFCFIYSAYIKEILEKLFNKKIIINVWENVIGYIVTRIIIIFILYFVLKGKKIEDKS